MTNDLIFILALVAGFYMAWSVGANDVANAFGTSIGSGALTFRHAILLAAIFEFCGAFFVGTRVSDTIRGGIVMPDAFLANPDVFALGMLASLLGAAVWLHVATCFGRPVSTTHAIIGGVLGFGLIAAGPDYVQWRRLLRIAASWFISPLIGGAIGFVVYRGIRKFVLNREHPMAHARTIVPIATGAVVLVLAWSMIENLAPRLLQEHVKSGCLSVFIASAVAVLAAFIARMMIEKQLPVANGTGATEYDSVERCFAQLQKITACYMAFAHGANDAANAIGPIVGVTQALKGIVASSAPTAPWILAFGGCGIVIGLATYGYKVIETVGRKITEVTPIRGFSAELGTASTVLFCSLLGLPISTTFVLIGSLMGVGLARGFGVIDLRAVRKIFMSWVITIPVSAFLSAVFFLILRAV